MTRGQAAPTPPKGTSGSTMFQLSGASKYDPEKFYTNGTDSKGHYERVRVKITPSLQALAEGYVNQISEYATVEDLIRDAILHRVMYFEQNGIPTDALALKRELHQAEMNRIRATYAAQDQYVLDCGDTLNRYVEVRDWKAMEECLAEMESALVDGGFPETTKLALEAAIEDGWHTMRTEVVKRRKRTLAID